LDRAFRFVERGLGGLVDLYICNANMTAQTLMKRVGVSARKIAVIHNGLDSNQMPVSAQLKPLAQRPLHVVVLANLSQRKGHIEFLDVIARVLKQVPQARFFFVGRDDLNGQVAQAVARQGLNHAVTLTGYQADVSPWLDSARVMVLPSLWGEGCPTSILEGFAYGLPVVAYVIDGVPELVTHGVEGFLVEQGDGHAFSAAIVSLLKEPVLAEKMGKLAYQKVQAQFTLSACAQAHSQALRALRPMLANLKE
jgi:glycosyltransferase involved in cell wall biosynthesis